MSSSIFDLLISETSRILNISTEEVKKKFTTEQLNAFLELSLCESPDEVGLSINSLDLPCSDLAVPELLPEVTVNISKLKNITPPDPSKCVENIKEINKVIQKQIDEYSTYNTLLEKLIEYRDNYIVIQYYFDERSKEMANILNLFEPLLLKLKDYPANIQNAEDSKKSTTNKIILATSIGNFKLVKTLTDKLSNINSTLSALKTEYSNLENELSIVKKSFPIFDNLYYKTIISSGSNILANDIYYLINSTISPQTIHSINSTFKQYSEGLSVIGDNLNPLTIKEAISTSYFKFNLKFINLNTLKLEKEIFEESTGNRHIEKYDFPIKNNTLLKKTSFFKNNSVFKLSEFTLNENQLPTGIIYDQYYNLFVDPINNFFTQDERGLTDNIDLVDPKVKGTDAQIKKEGASEYFIKDLNIMQQFYQNFDEVFSIKKQNKRKSIIVPAQEKIRADMKKLAKIEVQLLLILNRVDTDLVKESKSLQNTIDLLNQQNVDFITGFSELNNEISRIENKIEELKPTPDKIKKLLKESSPECFDKIDTPISDCGDTTSQLGIDPMFTKTLNGCDPTLPNQNQFCYWKQFSLILNTLGLLPIPNIPNFSELRYWPVGFTIVAPSGLVKIPLPIIWIPLLVLPSPMGTITIFLTINGIFISPIVFFSSGTGFKQHILTAKGSSEKFGYDSDDESVKSDIKKPISFLSKKDKASRLAKENILGKNYNLSEQEKIDLTKSENILNNVEKNATASNNSNRLLKVKKEKKNLNKAYSNHSDFEKMQNILDKPETIIDIIDDAKQAIFKRIDELGKPQLSSANKIKEKIVNRENSLLAELKNALYNGDNKAASNIRLELKNDGISLDEKISAIQSDIFSYFDKIKFPVITLPKDSSKIDPKQNAIIDFLNGIQEFSSIYKTQFQSNDNSKVSKILLLHLAKNKDLILEKISAISTEKMDVEKDTDKIKSALSETGKILISGATGTLDIGSSSEEKSKIEDIENQEKTETDPIKKKKLKKEKTEAQVKFSKAFDNEQTKEASLLTPAIIATLGALSVNFDSFAPCCKKESFQLPTTESPSSVIFKSAELILLGVIAGYGSTDLKKIFKGQTGVSGKEILSGFKNIINDSIPKDLNIQLPGLNIASFAASFAGLLTSMFEIKAPIIASQPALPTSIQIDLNILKAPLTALLTGYLINCLPDKNPTGSANDSSVTTSGSNTTLDKNIHIIGCTTQNLEESIFSKSSSKNTLLNSSNIIANTNKDILPNFQTLDTSFLSVNPEDLLSIVKNFIDLNFDKVEDILSPFYTIISAIKSPKNTNLNILEFAQQKVPPTGPLQEVKFTSITQLKKQIPKSATISIVDTVAIEAKKKILETVLSPIINSPLPTLLVAASGAIDSILPNSKIPKIDTTTGEIKTQDLKVASLALRQLHPILNQDDLPPWERLSSKNILFLVFLDLFISSAADRVGFFRNFI